MTGTETAVGSGIALLIATGALGVAWRLINRNMATLDNVKDRLSRVELNQDTRIVQCPALHAAIDSRLKLGDRGFTSMEKQIEAMQNTLNQTMSQGFRGLADAMLILAGPLADLCETNPNVDGKRVAELRDRLMQRVFNNLPKAE